MKIFFTTEKNGKPEELILQKERSKNGNYLISALAIDKGKNRCLDFNGRIYFSALNAGRLLNNLGTSVRSSIIEMANGKAQIKYKHIPLHKGIVEVRNQDFKGTYITIDE